MPVQDGDLKIYFSDVNGDIDLTHEWQDLAGVYDPVLDVDEDVEVKMHLKNTHATDLATRIKLWTVNGGYYDNTSGTTISGLKLDQHISPGEYSLIFPTANSVIVTGPDGEPLQAQPIVPNGSTYFVITINNNKKAKIQFSASLQTGNTAKLVISDGGEYLQLAPDNVGSPGTYAKKTSYADGINVGTLQAGESFAYWIKQVIPDGSTSVGNNRRYRMPGKGANQ